MLVIAIFGEFQNWDVAGIFLFFLLFKKKMSPRYLLVA